jgi:hypothetical protein
MSQPHLNDGLVLHRRNGDRLVDPRKQPAHRSENVRSSAPQTRIASRRAATKIAQSFA